MFGREQEQVRQSLARQKVIGPPPEKDQMPFQGLPKGRQS